MLAGEIPGESSIHSCLLSGESSATTDEHR